jgi:hypothetical protein
MLLGLGGQASVEEYGIDSGYRSYRFEEQKGQRAKHSATQKVAEK